MKAVAIVSPIVAIALQDLQELRRLHHERHFRLTTSRGMQADMGLESDPGALVGALLKLSLEALTIHLLAEAEPGRPVAEILEQAVQQVRGS